MHDDEDGWLKPVLVGLVALVGVSLLIGAVVSVAALGVADVAGVRGEFRGQAGSGETSMYVPSPGASGRPAGPQSPVLAPEPGEPAEPATIKRAPVRQGITMSATPRRVSAFERINLDGTYPSSNGATLQVQRFEAGWVDFPASATVQNDSFSTFVESGQTGPNRFRVVDGSGGRSSKPVTVNVG